MFVGSLDYNPKITNEYLCTTDKNLIDTFIQSSKTNSYHTIIAATYHSFNLLKDIPIDICTFDEAHNTVSGDEDPKMFRRNIEEVKPFIQQEYFFTATPKAIGETGGQRDQEFYGPILYELSPKEAVERLEIVQPKLHTVDIDGSFSETDVNHNNKLFIKTVKEAFSEHEKVLRVAAKLLVTGKDLNQVHNIYSDKNFQQWCKSKNITCFLFSSRIGKCVIDFDTSISYEEKLKRLKTDLNQRAIFFHYDILSEGMDIPNMTGCLFFRNLETNEIKFIQNIGRCSRLVLEDREKIYNNEITSIDDLRLKKPESWIVIPLYSINESTIRYKSILKRLRETYNIPFINVLMSRIVIGNPEKITEKINETRSEDSYNQKDFALKHDFETTILELIKEELLNQLEQDPDKEEFLSIIIDESYGERAFAYEQQLLLEGARKEIITNIYERNPNARQKCLDHHGYVCGVCNESLDQIYGEIAKYIIEVHHIIPLSEIGKQYVIDPIKDLIPICPNCHTIIHLKQNPCYTIDEVKKMIR
jgi:superfamily II DNA or RNA helicase